MQIINKLFNESYTNYSVIPNSVDFDKFLFSNNSNRNGFISAARIEPIKNQLMLAKIAKENAYNLTLVGGFTQNNVNYVNKVRTICENQSKIDLITQNIDQKTLGNMFPTA